MTLLEPTLIVRESSRKIATPDKPVLHNLHASGPEPASLARMD
jgi:hypothetical protein